MRRRIVLVVAILLGWLARPAGAAAHGSSTVQVDGDYGPYHVIVATNTPLVSEDWLVTVVLTKRASESEEAEPVPVLGAVVTATMEASGTPGSSQGGGASYPIPPEPSLAEWGYYEAQLPFAGEGDANVTIEIEGPDGPATVTFILSRALDTAAWIQLGLQMALIAATVVGGLAMLYMHSKRQAKVSGP